MIPIFFGQNQSRERDKSFDIQESRFVELFWFLDKSSGKRSHRFSAS